MKRFLLLASLAAVAVGGVAAIPANAGAAKVKCKLVGKKSVKCPAGKLRGPRGPQGPAGSSAVGSGAEISKIFFAENGDQDNVVLYDGNGFNLQASCDDTNNEVEYRTTEENSKLNYGFAPVGGADFEHTDINDFDTGDVIEVDGDNAMRFLTLVTPGGSVVNAQFITEDDDNSIFDSQIDCLTAGQITATP